MPRPAKKRIVEHVPDISFFLPVPERHRGRILGQFMAGAGTDAIQLTISELEALRLKHYQGLPQTKAADSMHISQSTFSRVLESAHTKITQALVEGKAIRIEGGTYKKLFKGFGCFACDHEWETENRSDERVVSACPKCGSSKTYKLTK